jgi:hypothetical protein
LKYNEGTQGWKRECVQLDQRECGRDGRQEEKEKDIGQGDKGKRQ